MGRSVFCAFVACTVLFATVGPVCCRVFVYEDMVRGVATRPELMEGLGCRYAGQIPYMELNVSSYRSLLLEIEKR